ncbi:MAG: hypothetical protein AUH25_06750 [Thaumarchaeota archaeon 13_1_40CM_38_12]|nr:MAG: hypothetical protein AUH25_06750 [Thaumarchaeota archaeon 13_1_40CM_38_12]OLC36421.1 MAG: hypothetical protein AUH84_01530 [Thaumarchaeota archaeon 13_1_40CM_4_38_7]OLC92343.1 MAG: hypothetical protein AUI92_05440 [Thaumarchaeota archaeon 13_1_40CM_3_38_6]OLD41445.1 MAG: hypothetical protein AUI60_01570 [Thaumarchaeota archaeon 13_1_40CM_2_39_4]TLY08161.1 MAG: hypothetical protein E6K83_03680 [Nitrososphaerota archaeon]
MVTPLFGAKVTGILLFSLGIIMIWFSVFLNFVALPILTKLTILADNNQYFMQEFFSGTVGSLIVGGLFALGVTDIIIAIGIIKQKKWAWKALVVLTIAGVLLNIPFMLGIQNITGVIVLIGCGIIDAGILFYVYQKQKQLVQTAEQAKITDKT